MKSHFKEMTMPQPTDMQATNYADALLRSTVKEEAVGDSHSDTMRFEAFERVLYASSAVTSEIYEIIGLAAEQAYRDGYESGHEAGYDEGNEEGHEEGAADAEAECDERVSNEVSAAEDSAYDNGYSDGYADGLTKSNE
jgi:flagellar biosynthesis/type III secretory pathway protein FliH